MADAGDIVKVKVYEFQSGVSCGHFGKLAERRGLEVRDTLGVAKAVFFRQEDLEKEARVDSVATSKGGGIAEFGSVDAYERALAEKRAAEKFSKERFFVVVFGSKDEAWAMDAKLREDGAVKTMLGTSMPKQVDGGFEMTFTLSRFSTQGVIDHVRDALKDSDVRKDEARLPGAHRQAA